MSEETKEKQPNLLLIGAGTMFTSMVIAGFLVGYWIDSLFGTQPFGLLACGVLGFIGGARKLHYLLIKMPQ